MSSISNTTRPPMKTRDKLKYTFALVLALMTIIGISGLMRARYLRQQTNRAEEMRMQQTMSTFGVNGELPKKVELPDAPPQGVNNPAPQ